MPSKSAKPAASKTAAAKKTTKRASVTSRNSLAAARQRRNFMAGVVLLSAALVALSLGMVGYYRDTGKVTNSQVAVVKKGEGVIYIKDIDAGKLENGQSVQVSVYENSGDEPINAVQAGITYPADKLKVANVRNSTDFPKEAATDTATEGLVRVARAVESQDKSVTGDKEVVTIEFTVINNEAPIKVNIDKNFSLLVRSTDNKNILDTTGANTNDD